MKYGLIGKNVSHSYSKFIHEKLFIKEYSLLSIDDVKDIFKYDLDGFNITNPYKEKIIPYLDECDDISIQTKAVNTVIKKNNKFFGYNTDFYGFKKLIEHYKVDLTNKNIVIIGNGATSRTIDYFLHQQPIQSVVKLVRSIKTDNEDLLRNQTKYMDTHIIINTTPVGMYPNLNDKLLINFYNFPQCELVIDLIYNPFRTKLLIEAEKHNIPTINGLYMLLMQAKKTEEILLNKKIDKELIRDIHHQIIHQYVNIVFIGLPFSGKSTYGQLLSHDLKKEWIDTDDKIEEYAKIKISLIFKLSGEAKFREIEDYVVQSIHHKSGIVISCGGGVPINTKNVELLKQNGFIIYINKSLDLIDHLDYDSRPLINDLNDLNKLYNQRHSIYKKASDTEIVIDKNNPFSLERLKAIIYEYFDH